MQEIPSFRNVQSQLYKKCLEVIPANPKTAKDFDVNSPWLNIENKTNESICIGDKLFNDGKRIVMFSTNDHLEILARVRQILCDVTFKITPTLWYHEFIINA